MSSTQHTLSRKFERMGYLYPVAEKIGGQWKVTAQDPLNNVSVVFERLGSSGKSALDACSKLPRIPDFYVCEHATTCRRCGAFDNPVGYTNSSSGDFIQRCRSCKFEWVAITAEEQIADTEARMQEASNVLNPIFRTFLNGKVS